MKMLHLLRSGAIVAALAAAGLPAHADYVVRQGDTGATLATLCGKTSNGIQIPCHVLVDATNAPIGTVANPFVSQLGAGAASIGSLLNITGTISLPTGAANQTLQSAGNTALNSIDGKTPALSVLPTLVGQTAGNTSLASIDAKTPALSALPTLTNQAAGNASVASIDAKTPALAVLPTLAGQTAGNTSLASLDTKATATNTKLDSLIAQAVPVTAPATPAAQAQPMQGVPGGVPVPVDTVIKGVGADKGGVIATANAAQTFMAANLARRAWSLQNQSSADLFINCSTTATADYHSLKVPAGAFYETPSTHVGTGACSIIGAVANASFYAREF